MIGRGRVPATPADLYELADVFHCLLLSGHTLEEAVLFLLEVTDDECDAEMRINTVTVTRSLEMP